MTITKSKNTFRGETPAKNINIIRKNIENSPYLKHKYKGNRVIRYIVEYHGYSIDVRTMSEKIVMLCSNGAVIEEFFRTVSE